MYLFGLQSQSKELNKTPVLNTRAMAVANTASIAKYKNIFKPLLLHTVFAGLFTTKNCRQWQRDFEGHAVCNFYL